MYTHMLQDLLQEKMTDEVWKTAWCLYYFQLVFEEGLNWTLVWYHNTVYELACKMTGEEPQEML